MLLDEHLHSSLTCIETTATLIFVIVIGITGGIGTGKSTVSGFLAELGAVIVDADKLGHELLQPQSDIYPQLLSTFGQDIAQPGKGIDRTKLGQIVFDDPQALKQLNNIMHPRMYKLAAERIEAYRQNGVSLVVLEAALLIEANWIPLIDQVWVTIASEDTVIERLGKNKGIAPEDVKARISSQLTAAERIKHARVVIYTDCSLERLRSRVKVHWQHLLAGQIELPDFPELKEKIKLILSNHKKRDIEDKRRIHSAVLMPLFENDGQYSLLFTRRTEEVNFHKGQICFPGGKISKQDKTARDAALRESFEEIGLWPEDVEILGELDDMYTVTSDFVISPFVGIIPGSYRFVSNPNEVQEIINIPLKAFWKETRFWLEGSSFVGPSGDTRYFDAIFFDYHEKVVWGATARILKSFLDLLIPIPEPFEQETGA